jgi:hypothetical protein
MTKPLLIGLTGVAGSGKDTVREILDARHGYDGIAFADPIRDMLRELLDSVGVDEKWMTERELKEREIPELGASYRQMAQLLGTEWGRTLHPDFWLKIAESRIALFRKFGSPGVVISDVRFPNEAAWVKAQGGVVWKILRPGIEAVRAHASESLVDTLPYDYVIDNRGSIADLKYAVDMALEYGVDIGMREHAARENDARLIAESNALATGPAQ